MLKKPSQVSDLRIGLADPNPYSRGVIATQLKEYAVRSVTEYPDSTELLAQLASKPVHAVIAGVDLLPEGGLEVLTSLRSGQASAPGQRSGKIDPHIPVILVTSDTDKAKIETAVRKGVNAILTRPIQRDRLEKAMDRVFTELNRGFVTGLQFEKVRRPDYSRFVFFGQFVRSSQDTIRTVFEELRKDTNKDCVLDFSNVNFIDEFGFGTLLMLHGVGTQLSKRIAMIAPFDTIGGELRSIGVGEVIPVFDSHIDYVDSHHFQGVAKGHAEKDAPASTPAEMANAR